MKAIIVDDESNGIEALKWELNRAFPDIDVVETFTSPTSALAYLNGDASIDLVFLDIQMPEMSGFEMLEKLEKVDFSVVFVTSYDSYALKAFQYSALDYILKPADQESLKRAIAKIGDARGQQTEEPNYQQRLQIHQSALDGNLPQKVAFSTKEAYEFIDPKEVLYCESYSNYTTIYLENSEKLVVSKTLKEMDALLEKYGFQRIHQRFVVNLSFIKRFIKGDGGAVELTTGQQLSVSRAKKEELLSRFKSYLKR